MKTGFEVFEWNC